MADAINENNFKQVLFEYASEKYKDKAKDCMKEQQLGPVKSGGLDILQSNKKIPAKVYKAIPVILDEKSPEIMD